MNFVVSVDVGGTNLRGALVSREGEILSLQQEPVGSLRDEQTMIRRIADLVKRVAGDHWKEVLGVGVGFPGIIHFETGRVLQSPHYPDLKNASLRGPLQKILQKKVVLDNDANMAAVGEQWKGEGQKHSSFIMLTLGTGVGGALILDGKLWRGEEGFAGEVGHITVQAEGRQCNCGNRGCWETYVSAQGKNLSEIKDPVFWKEFGNYFAIGVCSLVNVTGVYTIIVGGGVSAAWNSFFPVAQEGLSKHIYAAVAPKIRLIRSNIFDKAALLGAAHSLPL